MPKKKGQHPSDLTIDWLNRLLNLLAETCNVPAALIMRVHPEQIEVLSSASTPESPYKVGQRENLNCGLYCEYVMAKQKPLLVPDATEDPFWANNPDIKLGMISYLGFPLVWPDGKIYGTICILDSKKNQYSERIKSIVELFKNIVEAQLALIFESEQTKRALDLLRSNREELAEAISVAVDAKVSSSQMIRGASNELYGAVADLVNILKSAEIQNLVANQANPSFDVQTGLVQIINKINVLSNKLAEPQTITKY